MSENWGWSPLEPVVEHLYGRTGVPLDQIRYILLMISCYPLSLILRHLLHPSHTPLYLRYAFSLTTGLMLGFMCFTWQQMITLLIIVLVCYLILYLPPAYTQRYTMVWAMGSLSAAHIYRMVYDYGNYTLDFTGPLMIMVQKITQVGFALHDGKARPDSELNPDQRKQKLTSIPSLVEYFTFLFCFHLFLTGPVCTIREFQDFMTGTNFSSHLPPHSKESRDANRKIKEPSALYPVLTRLSWSLLSVAAFQMLGNYNNDLVLDPQYNLLTRILLNNVNIFRIRLRYYFFWFMAESFNDCVGLGFSGYDKQGQAKWDLATNVNFVDVELATSIRIFSIKWNSLSSLWLRRCVYERATFAPTLMTFAVSAWWHGFYPGYYMGFIYVGLMNEASKKMRRLMRHYFQGHWALRLGYDVLTWSMTYMFLGFGLPIDLMLFNRSITYWSYYYYFPLITVCVVTFLFPSGKKQTPKTATKEQKAD